MRFHCFVFHHFPGAFASQKLVQGWSPRITPPTREHSFFYFETHSPQSITIEIGEVTTPMGKIDTVLRFRNIVSTPLWGQRTLTERSRSERSLSGVEVNAH